MASPISVQIDQDIKEVERLLRGLGRGADRVISRAINRTLTSVNSVAVKSIAKDLRIKQKDVRKELRQKKSTFSNRNAEIQASGNRIPLIAFNAKETRRGVTYRHRDGGRRLAIGAFKATVGVGRHEGIFKRIDKRRLPIVELRGASIPFVMVQRIIRRSMDDKGAERWPIEIRQQLQNFIRSRGRG